MSACEDMNENENEYDEQEFVSIYKFQRRKRVPNADQVLKKQKQTVLSCPICPQKFTSNMIYHRHLKLHSKIETPDRLRKCEHCDFTIEGDENAVRLHEIAKHPMHLFSKVFPDDATIRNLNEAIIYFEKRGTTIAYPAKCTICNAKLEGKFKSRQHFLDEHLSEVVKIMENQDKQILQEKNRKPDRSARVKTFKSKPTWHVQVKTGMSKSRVRVETEMSKPKSRVHRNTGKLNSRVQVKTTRRNVKYKDFVKCKYCKWTGLNQCSLKYHEYKNHAGKFCLNLPSETTSSDVGKAIKNLMTKVKCIQGQNDNGKYRCTFCNHISLFDTKTGIHHHLLFSHFEEIVTEIMNWKWSCTIRAAEITDRIRRCQNNNAGMVDPMDVESFEEDESTNNLDNMKSPENQKEDKIDILSKAQEEVVEIIDLESDNEELDPQPCSLSSIKIVNVVGSANHYQVGTGNDNQAVSNSGLDDDSSDVEIIREIPPSISNFQNNLPQQNLQSSDQRSGNYHRNRVNRALEAMAQ